DRAALEESAAAEDRVLLAQPRDPADELGEELEVAGAFPVDPRQLAVLCVDVVVAALGAAQLVTVQQHRQTLGQKQRRQEVALILLAKCDDLEVVGLSFDTAVPRPVVTLPVVVVLAVGVVVLVVV